MLAFYLTLADNGRDLFERIYLRYKNLMLTRAYEILGDTQLAEDAVHNAFMRILKNLAKLDSAESARTRGYVMIVTENVAKTMYNQNRRQAVIELDEAVADTFEVAEKVEQRLTAELLAQKIALLPDNYRGVILLKYLHGLSDREIASSLSISQSAVRKRLERARKALSKLIGGNIDG